MKRIFITLIVIVICNLFNPAMAIKIGVVNGADRIGVGASVNALIVDANTHHNICELDAMKGYEIKPYKNKMAIKYDDKYYQIDSDNIVLKVTEDGFVSVKRNWYRGHLVIQNKTVN